MRRSTVLRIPLQLVFPVLFIQTICCCQSLPSQSHISRHGYEPTLRAQPQRELHSDVGSSHAYKHQTRMEVTGTTSYEVYYGLKRYYSPGACIIKLIVAVIYRFLKRLECLSPGKPFQPSLVCKDKHSSLLRKLKITATISFMIQASGAMLQNFLLL